MKRTILKLSVAVALGAIAICITASAFARVGRVGKQDFILHNETGVEIHNLHVSPVSTDDWEEDILGRDTLPSGESVKVTFEDREKHVHWDLKVQDHEGNSLEWHDLNLIEIEEVTLHWDAHTGKGWAVIK
jgi:hypothetical protein